jgi:hypothetical protein
VICVNVSVTIDEKRPASPQCVQSHKIPILRCNPLSNCKSFKWSCYICTNVIHMVDYFVCTDEVAMMCTLDGAFALWRNKRQRRLCYCRLCKWQNTIATCTDLGSAVLRSEIAMCNTATASRRAYQQACIGRIIVQVEWQPSASSMPGVLVTREL